MRFQSGISAVSVRYQCGISVVSVWYPCGILAVSLRYQCGISVVYLRMGEVCRVSDDPSSGLVTDRGYCHHILFYLYTEVGGG